MNEIESSIVELVFGCQDTAERILNLVDVESLGVLRLSNKVLRDVVDRWIIKRLVLDIDHLRSFELCTTVQVLSKRFLSVDQLVIRHAKSSAEIATLMQAWWIQSSVEESGRGAVKRLELEYCTLENWDDNIIFQDKTLLHGIERLELSGCLCASIDSVSSLVHSMGPVLHTIRVGDVAFRNSRVQLPSFHYNDSSRNIKTVIFLDNIVDSTQQAPLFSCPSSLSLYQERLENLDLSGNVLGLDNIRLLFQEGEFVKLKRLRLRRCNLHESHAEVMSFSSSLVALCYLDLAENQLGTQAAMFYISSSLQLTKQIRYLNLSNQYSCQQDWLYGWYVSVNPWERLTTLKMNHVSFNAAGMHGLLQSLMPSMKQMFLCDSFLTSDALAMLGRSDLLAAQLETLDLSGTTHGVEVRRAVSALTKMRAQKLQRLILKSSGLTSARAKSADRKALKELCAFHGPDVKIQLSGS